MHNQEGIAQERKKEKKKPPTINCKFTQVAGPATQDYIRALSFNPIIYLAQPCGGVRKDPGFCQEIRQSLARDLPGSTFWTQTQN